MSTPSSSATSGLLGTNTNSSASHETPKDLTWRVPATRSCLMSVCDTPATALAPESPSASSSASKAMLFRIPQRPGGFDV